MLTLLSSQIIASASAVYDIPWPPAFLSFISMLRLFLADIISITKAECSQPMNYYTALLVVLMGLKIALALLVIVPWLFGKLQQSSLGIGLRIRQRRITKQLNQLQQTLVATRNQASVVKELQRNMSSVERRAKSLDWTKVFKATFMLLFIAYPGASCASSTFCWRT